MDFLNVTKRYYNAWLGAPTLADAPFGVIPIYSAERNKIQEGYGAPFDLYVLLRDGRISCSYGDKLSERADTLAKHLSPDDTAEQAAEKIRSLLNCEVSHNIKYFLERMPEPSDNARPLSAEDYPCYREFFLQMNPGADVDGWLKDYFDGMVSEQLCCGVFIEGKLVSCTDAPSVPYLSGEVCEIGINTLPEYRGRGYAAGACALAMHNSVLGGKCPIWSTGADNTASQRLAEKLGFRKFADLLTVTL